MKRPSIVDQGGAARLLTGTGARRALPAAGTAVAGNVADVTTSPGSRERRGPCDSLRPGSPAQGATGVSALTDRLNRVLAGRHELRIARRRPFSLTAQGRVANVPR